MFLNVFKSVIDDNKSVSNLTVFTKRMILVLKSLSELLVSLLLICLQQCRITTAQCDDHSSFQCPAFSNIRGM